MADVVLVRFLQVQSATRPGALTDEDDGLREVLGVIETGRMQCCLCGRLMEKGPKPKSFRYIGVRVACDDAGQEQKVGYAACESCVSLSPNEAALQGRVDREMLAYAERGERLMKIVGEN